MAKNEEKMKNFLTWSRLHYLAGCSLFPSVVSQHPRSSVQLVGVVEEIEKVGGEPVVVQRGAELVHDLGENKS